MTVMKTTIYIESDLCDMLREKTGMSISAICRLSMEMLANNDMNDVTLHLKLSRIQAQREKYQVEKMFIEKQLEELDDLQGVVQVKYDETVKREYIQGLVQKLNGALIFNGYDKDDIDPQLLKDIMVVNPNFNLTKHIERFKKIVEQ